MDARNPTDRRVFLGCVGAVVGFVVAIVVLFVVYAAIVAAYPCDEPCEESDTVTTAFFLLVVVALLGGPIAGAVIAGRDRTPQPPVPVQSAAVHELARRLDEIGAATLADRLHRAVEARREFMIPTNHERATVLELLSSDRIKGLEALHWALERDHSARARGGSVFAFLPDD